MVSLIVYWQVLSQESWLVDVYARRIGVLGNIVDLGWRWGGGRFRWRSVNIIARNISGGGDGRKIRLI